MSPDRNNDARQELAPSGVLRAGINLGNALLVTGRTQAGDPAGVAPDMAKAIADALGVELAFAPFPSPGEVADALAQDAWDIALIADEPQRAETIAFTPAYVEIEATYLVREGSDFQKVEELDREGVQIATSARSAYELYLTRTLERATLHRGHRMTGAYEIFEDQKMDALAGLRSALTEIAEKHEGLRVLPGRYSTVQQAIGTKPDSKAGLAFLKDFVADAKASGLVAKLIEKHGVGGKLQVAED